MGDLTHFDAEGQARMVDVGEKPVTSREAVARGYVRMKAETLSRILDRSLEKGDVLAVAQLAGIMGAKRTSDLIPLCHPLPISSVQLVLTPEPSQNRVRIEATVRTQGRTGVEMEALTAVSVAGLTLYDMCKAIDREMTLEDIGLLRKSGGRSGDFVRQEGDAQVPSP